jgi:N-acetylmuramoyl-L-alanine amidase
MSKLNNMPCIIADDILLFDPNSGLKNWANTISGSFTYPSGQKPCSIMINKGVDIYSYSCHGWLGFPETVLYRYKDGEFGIGKFKSTSEIPNRKEVLWAIGGMGLLDKYNPSEEGFSRFVKNGKTYDYSDVLRLTSHTLIGIKDNECYLVYITSMTGSQGNEYAKECGFEKALWLDGGHISAINSTDTKINIDTTQGYAIQGITSNFTEPLNEPINEPVINIDNSSPMLVIDAGHNSLNRSNRSPDGSYIEADFNLELVNLIIPHVNRCGIRIKFIESINSNQSIELNDLVNQIDDSGGDVMVSIHTDAYSNTTAKGQTIYCYELNPAKEGMKLAQAIHDATIPESGMIDRGIKDEKGSIRVIFAPLMPCVLIECGFHTNLDDLTRLKSKEWKEKEAILIAKGILNYFGLEYIEPITVVDDSPKYLYHVVKQYGAYSTRESAQAEVDRISTVDDYVYIEKKEVK